MSDEFFNMLVLTVNRNLLGKYVPSKKNPLMVTNWSELISWACM